MTDNDEGSRPMTPGGLRALSPGQVVAGGWRPADVFDTRGLEVLAGASISAWVLLTAGQRRDVAVRAEVLLERGGLDEETAALTRWEIEILRDAALAARVRAVLPIGIVAAEEGRTDVLLRPFPLTVLDGNRRHCNACGVAITGTAVGVMDRLEPPDGPGDTIDDLIWCAECVTEVVSQLTKGRLPPTGRRKDGS